VVPKNIVSLMLLGMFQINILYSEEVATVCRA